MAQRALLIGSQTGGLTGVHRDVDLMAETLEPLGFEVRRHIDSAASYAGMTGAYRELIQDAGPDDVVVVYYSGHGWRSRNEGWVEGGGEPQWLQYIVPTDIDNRSGGAFRGLLGTELSVFQAQLTAKTRNVTTFLDCCHAARMLRDQQVVPRAYPDADFPWQAVRDRWRALFQRAQVARGDTNPHAVQLVACQPHESAYELPIPATGLVNGAFTVALVEVLQSESLRSASWREAIDVIRRRVATVVAVQTPEILGTTGAADRCIFTLTTKDATGVLPVFVDRGQAWLRDASLLGIAEGDTYAILRPGGDPQKPLTEATVDRLRGGRAHLALATARAGILPDGAQARPLTGNLSRRPVAIVPVDHPRREEAAETIRSLAHTAVTEEGYGALATVELEAEGMRLLDAEGLPMAEAHVPYGDGAAESIAGDLRRLARAAYVRELPSGQADEALPDDVDISFARLDPTVPGGEVPLDPAGEHLFDGDNFIVRMVNRSDQARYVSALDVGLRGGVALLTSSGPAGIRIEPGETYILGEDLAHRIVGIEMYWPEGLPPAGPRPETCVVITSDREVEGLASLAQDGIAVNRGVLRSGLDWLLADVAAGTRETRPNADLSPTRYGVRRLDVMLHPVPRGDDVGEPDFRIDRRPDPSFRLVPPAPSPDCPSGLEIKLSDLAVDGLPAGRARVDVLALTGRPGGLGGTLQARTAWVAPAAGSTDVAGLEVVDLVAFSGPVAGFVDLAVWVTPGAGEDGPDLAALLAPRLDDPEVTRAVKTLSDLGGPRPAAEVVADANGAVSRLVRVAAGVLDETAVGVFRTSLCAHTGFGAVGSGRRHPAAGSIEGNGAQVAFEVAAAGS